jgi:hypothetical protein
MPVGSLFRTPLFSADADKFRLEVQPGNGRIVQCLVNNEANLAEQCVTALKETGMWEIGVQ